MASRYGDYRMGDSHLHKENFLFRDRGSHIFSGVFWSKVIIVLRGVYPHL